jgi:hypothetical protein
MYRRRLRHTAGNSRAAGDPVGQVTTMVFDAHNRLIEQADGEAEAASGEG